jgi:hypothetical protein
MKYKGVPILVGVALILLNLIIHFVWPKGWFARSELLLHLGAIVALLGYLIGDVLG